MTVSRHRSALVWLLPLIDLCPPSNSLAIARSSTARLYSAAAAAEVSEPSSAPPSSSPSTPPLPFPRSTYRRYDKETTPAKAQAYLSDLLNLPESAAFPPALALQLLTHKSYRFAHRIAHAPPYTADEIANSQASHNERLSFLGRRALQAYTGMFVHSALPSTSAARASPLFSAQALEASLEDLIHPTELGRTVGQRWHLDSVMRWDRVVVSYAAVPMTHKQGESSHSPGRRPPPGRRT